jgi:AraC-like DNA-binding protein
MEGMSPVGSPPVQDVLLVARFTRAEGFTFSTTSLPGHLIQVTISGAVHLEVSGQQYDLKRGDAIWFHEDEHQRGRVLQAPWSFYSVNFIAPTLPPPAFDARVWSVKDDVIAQFAALHEAWYDTGVPPAVRELQVHVHLLQLLAKLTTHEQLAGHVDPRARLWWELETELRKDLRRAMNLATMAKIAQASPATVSRSCRYALGISPLKRLKQVRLSLARGLVWSSKLTMTEIAERVGFRRIHEFSRDFRNHFGVSPSYARAHSDYDALRREISRGYGRRYGVARPRK